MSNDLLTVTAFPSDKATKGIRSICTWDELKEALGKPRVQSIPKNSLGMWSAATFKDNNRKKGCVVESVCLLVFDVDEDPVPSLDELQNALSGWDWFAHSTSKATKDSPRWRLVFRLSRPVTAEEYLLIWQEVSEQLPFPVGPQSKNASRAWYLPRIGEDGVFIRISSARMPLTLGQYTLAPDGRISKAQRTVPQLVGF